MTMSDNTIALATLATEWGTTADQLARQLGDKVVVDSLGVRWARHRDAAELLARRRERNTARAEADAARRSGMVDTARDTRDRIKAIRAAHAANPLIVDDLSMTEAAHLVVKADHLVGRQAASAAVLDDYLSGGGVVLHPSATRSSNRGRHHHRRTTPAQGTPTPRRHQQARTVRHRPYETGLRLDHSSHRRSTLRHNPQRGRQVPLPRLRLHHRRAHHRRPMRSMRLRRDSFGTSRIPPVPHHQYPVSRGVMALALSGAVTQGDAAWLRPAHRDIERFRLDRHDAGCRDIEPPAVGGAGHSRFLRQAGEWPEDRPLSVGKDPLILRPVTSATHVIRADACQ